MWFGGGVRKENSTRPTGLTGYVMAGSGFGVSAESRKWQGTQVWGCLPLSTRGMQQPEAGAVTVAAKIQGMLQPITGNLQGLPLSNLWKWTRLVPLLSALILVSLTQFLSVARNASTPHCFSETWLPFLAPSLHHLVLFCKNPQCSNLLNAWYIWYHH